MAAGGRVGRRFLAVVAAAVVLGACSSGFDEAAALQAGLEAQAAGKLAEADGHYLAVVGHDPRNKLAWYDLGVIAQRDGQTAQAQHDYLQALASDPQYVPALYNLALVESAASPQTAIGLYQQVTRLQPGDAAAHYNLGILLEKQGQTARGQQEITTALTLNPSLART